MSEETNLVNYFLWTIIEGDLDIIYEHKKWRRKRRGEAQGSLIVIGSLVSYARICPGLTPLSSRVMAMPAS